MKTINYRGMTFEVEDHFKYIVTDKDDSVWIFEYEPEYSHHDEEWLVVGGDYQQLEPNFKPEDSLEKV